MAEANDLEMLLHPTLLLDLEPEDELVHRQNENDNGNVAVDGGENMLEVVFFNVADSAWNSAEHQLRLIVFREDSES